MRNKPDKKNRFKCFETVRVFIVCFWKSKMHDMRTKRTKKESESLLTKAVNNARIQQKTFSVQHLRTQQYDEFYYQHNYRYKMLAFIGRVEPDLSDTEFASDSTSLLVSNESWRCQSRSCPLLTWRPCESEDKSTPLQTRGNAYIYIYTDDLSCPCLALTQMPMRKRAMCIVSHV